MNATTGVSTSDDAGRRTKQIMDCVEEMVRFTHPT